MSRAEHSKSILTLGILEVLGLWVFLAGSGEGG